jgi:glutathione S-transferase
LIPLVSRAPLTPNRFSTYFPHVDNIYSHRSTQRYKRKPFVSHYWDCRLKGRPPGTPKSDDPNKRKRLRQARERDLCDVKIKITEYFPGARAVLGQQINDGTADAADGFGGEHFATPLQDPLSYPGSNGERFFTIQRVNGNGANGKKDGVAGPHKHTLADSDRVKKNSIQRQLLKEEKEIKKLQVCIILINHLCDLRVVPSGPSSSETSVRLETSSLTEVHHLPQHSLISLRSSA